MEIKYLQLLGSNPVVKAPDSEHFFTNEPLSSTEIASLENLYNNGSSFPSSLRELLSIAGKSCYVLEYAAFESQEEMQQESRSWLIDDDRNLSITRPYFVLDVYNYGEKFLFVYLDEGEDPIVYQALLDEEPWINSLGSKLSEYVESSVKILMSGYNPF
ncbi:SMI1/KNR4 family protein [Mucilaginibacter angelicae]|uniref:SMI1/KNR4 family protein n=1 Tax=Mucilaginibacter angelicae TaxID=869718 RepID=A0ABV6L538_9SPHI